MDFRIMHSGMQVDVFAYTVDFLSENPEVEVHIGCDSQNYQNHTVYVTALVFRFPGQGGHVLYHKEKVKRIPDLWTKLWGELERSIALAESLDKYCGVRVSKIDLDFNSDPAYPSNRLLSAATGYIQSLGYQAQAKPSMLIAAWAANVLCH